MGEVIEKLLRIEKEYGSEIFFDRQRATALIKDFFAEYKRERKLLEKGVELNVYKKIFNLPITNILMLKTTLMKELCEEHGLSEDAAEYTIDIWINLIEKKRQVKILEPYSAGMKRALTAYKRNIEKSEEPAGKVVVVQNNNNYNVRMQRKRLKKQALKLKRNVPTAEDIEKSPTPEVLPKKPLPNILGSTLYNLQEFEDAVIWFKKAAEQGDLTAQNNLAYCYLYGKGIERNVNVAVEWFTKAAYSGELTAMVNLANCYYEGIGVHRDISKALPWYAKAAILGDPSAQYILGECFYKGDGVKKSKAEAIKWYELAAVQQHAGAIERLNELEYYASLLRSRAEKENQRPKSTEVSAYTFAARIMSRVIDETLIRNIQIQSDSYDLISVVRNTILGLGLNLDKNEYPVFLYNDSRNSVVKFSDITLFTTNGVYIRRYLRRTNFLYYADINEIKLDDNARKRIWINKYFINCSALESESITRFMKIINETIMEFR